MAAASIRYSKGISPDLVNFPPATYSVNHLDPRYAELAAQIGIVPPRTTALHLTKTYDHPSPYKELLELPLLSPRNLRQICDYYREKHGLDMRTGFSLEAGESSTFGGIAIARHMVPYLVHRTKTGLLQVLLLNSTPGSATKITNTSLALKTAGLALASGIPYEIFYTREIAQSDIVSCGMYAAMVVKTLLKKIKQDKVDDLRALVAIDSSLGHCHAVKVPAVCAVAIQRPRVLPPGWEEELMPRKEGKAPVTALALRTRYERPVKQTVYYVGALAEDIFRYALGEPILESRMARCNYYLYDKALKFQRLFALPPPPAPTCGSCSIM